MHDAYAELPPRKRRYAFDTLRPVIPRRMLIVRAAFIAMPGVVVGVSQFQGDKPIVALLALIAFLFLPSYLVASALSLGYTETLQRGIHLRRKENIRYWSDVVLFCGLYLFVCAALVGI